MIPVSRSHLVYPEHEGPLAPAGEVVEFSFLLSQSQMAALEQAAQQRHLTAGEMARRVLDQFIRQVGAAAVNRRTC